MGIKKGTKLTENPKGFMLRVRLDNDTVKKLDAVCEKKKQNRSETVRNAICELYLKEKK